LPNSYPNPKFNTTAYPKPNRKPQIKYELVNIAYCSVLLFKKDFSGEIVTPFMFYSNNDEESSAQGFKERFTAALVHRLLFALFRSSIAK